MNIAAFYVAGLNPGNFTVSNSTCGSALAANASCTVTVTYSGTTAFTQANLSFADDAANTTDQSVPLTAGTAPTPPTSTVLAFGANPIQFGTVNRGTTKDQTISLKNAGTANATLGLIFTSTPSFVVQQTPSTTCNTGTSLAPGKTCNIVVRFTAPSTTPVPNPVTAVLEVDAANIPGQKVTTSLTATVK